MNPVAHVVPLENEERGALIATLWSCLGHPDAAIMHDIFVTPTGCGILQAIINSSHKLSISSV